MSRASEAPFALVDIVYCLKSWTTVDAERCSQCSPTNGNQEEDGFRERSPPGRRRTWTSSHGSLPKNLIAAHTMQGSQADEGSEGTCSPATPCAEVWVWEARGLLRCGFSWEQLWKTEIWTDRGLRIYGYDRKGERQRRIPGDGKRKGR